MACYFNFSTLNYALPLPAGPLIDAERSDPPATHDRYLFRLARERGDGAASTVLRVRMEFVSKWDNARREIQARAEQTRMVDNTYGAVSLKLPPVVAVSELLLRQEPTLINPALVVPLVPTGRGALLLCADLRVTLVRWIVIDADRSDPQRRAAGILHPGGKTPAFINTVPIVRHEGHNALLQQHLRLRASWRRFSSSSSRPSASSCRGYTPVLTKGVICEAVVLATVYPFRSPNARGASSSVARDPRIAQLKETRTGETRLPEHRVVCSTMVFPLPGGPSRQKSERDPKQEDQKRGVAVHVRAVGRPRLATSLLFKGNTRRRFLVAPKPILAPTADLPPLHAVVRNRLPPPRPARHSAPDFMKSRARMYTVHSGPSRKHMLAPSISPSRRECQRRRKAQFGIPKIEFLIVALRLAGTTMSRMKQRGCRCEDVRARPLRRASYTDVATEHRSSVALFAARSARPPLMSEGSTSAPAPLALITRAASCLLCNTSSGGGYLCLVYALHSSFWRSCFRQ
ncbi:hypothetical protein B0H11DRAFT_2383065 [Mycena galericulata]|nr:hypothetical protein B0H11DRAFT_2383065 [Mycena galericulata]